MNRSILFYIPSGQPDLHSKLIEVDIDVALRDIIPLLYHKFKFGWLGIELRYGQTVMAYSKTLREYLDHEAEPKVMIMPAKPFPEGFFQKKHD